jgi:hypothetical protein
VDFHIEMTSHSLQVLVPYELSETFITLVVKLCFEPMATWACYISVRSLR